MVERRSSEDAPIRVVDLLWGTRRTPRRGPRPRLSLDSIIETGIAHADAEGLAELSMQRIADELGYTKMSLYRYTPGKAELTAVMLDTALGPPPDLEGSPPHWRARLRAWALAAFPVLLAHPWIMDATRGARVLGPNEVGWTEAGVATLAGTGLTGSERLDAVSLVHGHVRHVVGQSAGASMKRSSAPERDLQEAMSAIIAERSDRYPELGAAFAEAGAESERDDALVFGLDRILDGLEKLIAEREAPSV